jgi:DNA-binding transcriptional MerR regulator
MQELQDKPNELTELPPIPSKRYFAIGEVAELCGVKPHVLRFWEQEFSQLNPNKRRGNRRYYQLKDLLLIRQIRNMLYDQNLSIENARVELTASIAKAAEKNVLIRKTIVDLEHILADLR